ncbi:hypothetical protein OHA25_27400 [Nonomuraea sp. NBC_00507]|uniref:Clp protease N-terminal domain-containing protein n=1 Tax=Nonomuraea sp. NBC_00507 TaxID=2976002 RepID=UPI002E16E0EB
MLDLASEEAAAHHHECVSPEHLLLGLVRLNKGVALYSLARLGISSQAVQEQIQHSIANEIGERESETFYTPRAKQVLDLSRREASQLGHGYIGTEHILLGLIKEGQGTSARVLEELGADLHRVRQKILDVLRGPVPLEWAQ